MDEPIRIVSASDLQKKPQNIDGFLSEALTYKPHVIVLNGDIGVDIYSHAYAVQQVAKRTQNEIIKNNNASHKLNAEKKHDRKERIIAILKAKKDVTVKDVAQVIVGCSEKTIQRELIALVKGNILKREGNKRWSKYSLK